MEIKVLGPLEVTERCFKKQTIFFAHVHYMIKRDCNSFTGTAQFAGPNEEYVKNEARDFFKNGKVKLTIKGELE